jgi:hypothetical protein
MSDATRTRMVARMALVQLDALVDDGLREHALEQLILAAEMLAVAPFSRACQDPAPHLRDLRDVLETVAGRTAASLVATLDDLLGRAARIPLR